MKNLLAIVFCFSAMSFTIWEPDFETAKQTSKTHHQLMLLNFSGSDWCGPCMRMRKEIFENKSFTNMADTNLVMVNADFPRNKKNQLAKNIKMQNEKLADQYNPQGKFPFTLLLDCDGKIIKTWDGLPAENAAAFAKQIKTIVDARK